MKNQFIIEMNKNRSFLNVFKKFKKIFQQKILKVKTIFFLQEIILKAPFVNFTSISNIILKMSLLLLFLEIIISELHFIKKCNNFQQKQLINISNWFLIQYSTFLKHMFLVTIIYFMLKRKRQSFQIVSSITYEQKNNDLANF